MSVTPAGPYPPPVYPPVHPRVLDYPEAILPGKIPDESECRKR